MTPINHYEGDRPKDFYNDGLFIRFATRTDEIPSWSPVLEVRNGCFLAFTKVDKYVAAIQIDRGFIVGRMYKEYSYRELHRILIETIGNDVLNELLNNKS